MSEFKYAGSELELFADVHNWKSYWSSKIKPYIAGNVLEIGAGIGANTPYLRHSVMAGWTCLEPDAELFGQLKSKVRTLDCEVVCGTAQDLTGRQFDTILYIDVLEHIEDDKAELERAARLLREQGRVIVLSPAHQGLYTPFDAAIGHFRRYDRASLRSISPDGLRFEKMQYLDSTGLLLSSANRVFLQQSMPTKAQLNIWDHWVIPISRILDRCSFGLAGKSVLAIWQKP